MIVLTIIRFTAFQAITPFLFWENTEGMRVETETESEAKPLVYKGIPGIMCEGEASFQNARINGRPVEVSKMHFTGKSKKRGMPGGWFRKPEASLHRKSREWNEAFEGVYRKRQFS